MRTMMSALMLGLCATVALGEDTVDNPQYKTWAGCKVGATVKYEITTAMQKPGAPPTSKMTRILTLKELTPEKAVVEAAMTMEGSGHAMPPQLQDIPAKIEASKVDQPGQQPAGVKMTKKDEGDEEITVGGKNYKAHWTLWEMTTDQKSSTTKMWRSTDVPNGVLKAVTEITKPTAMTSKIELVEFKTGA